MRSILSALGTVSFQTRSVLTVQQLLLFGVHIQTQTTHFQRGPASSRVRLLHLDQAANSSPSPWGSPGKSTLGVAAISSNACK